jgi:ABC-type branched-subunit amino acid transport system ATPase component/ABC-type branched-subunit amino acid transport system permease subunit
MRAGLPRLAPIALLVAVAATAPWLLPNYYLHTLTTAGIFIMLSSGLNLIHGYVGRLSLGHTAFYGLGAYTAGMLASGTGAGLLLTIPAAILVAVLAGLAIGHITLRFRGAHFVLVTLAFAAILQLLANNLVDLTGGPMGLSGIASPLVHRAWGDFHLFGSKASFYWLVLAFDVFTVYVVWRVVHSPVGDAMIALREDEHLAEAIGINEYRYSMIAFVLGAAIAGAAGAIYAHYVSFVSPEIFSFNIMIMILVMVILGSVGTVVGPVIGSVLVIVLLEALRLQEALREPIFGAVLVGATLLFPQGLALLAGVFAGRPPAREKSRQAARAALPTDALRASDGALPPAPSCAAAAPRGPEGAVLLRVEQLSVRFGGLVAVDDVSFEVRRGQIVSLIGPNGAGKTTTLNLVTGFIERSAGRIAFDGQALPQHIRPNRVAARGMIRTFQTTRGLLGMAIGKAVQTGLHRTLSLTWPRIARAALFGLPEMQLAQRAAVHLREVGLERHPDELTANLSYGEQRLLEVAIALAARPQLLVLDEPVAGMNPEETSRMMALIRRLRAAGMTILLVEHDMKFVMGLSDHIVVLDHGKLIAQGTPQAIQNDPAVVEAYLGHGVGHAAA